MKRVVALTSLPLLLTLVLAPVAGAGDDNSCPWRARASVVQGSDYTLDDIAEEVEFGKQVAARILGQHQLVRTPALQRYVSLVGTSLAAHSSRPELKFRFAVVESSQVNAYSTPGGYVFVTTAALDLMKSEAELAGVLAHEIAHVSERHLVKDLNIRGSDTSGVSSILAIIGGATDAARIAFTQAVDKAVDVLFRDGYKQADEMQADEQAVSLTALAGYDPAGLESYLSRVAEQKAPVGKSYPRYDTRLELIRAARAGEGVPAGFGRQGAERFAAALRQQK